MTTLTEGLNPAESLVSEAPGERSREAITVASGNVVTPCQVLGAVQTGTPTATAGTPFSAGGGTVGNGTLTGVSADARAMAGNWLVEIVGAAGATAAFRVVRPDGSIDGQGNVGTAYNGTNSINFTLADGSTDWGPNMFVPITVEYLDGDSVLKYEPLDTSATDGSQVAAGISYGSYDATSADVRGVAFVRDCEHNADIVKWPTGISADNKQRAINQLAALGIILR